MKLGSLLRKFRRNVQDYGRWMALHKTAAYFLSPVYQRTVYTIYVIDLDEAPTVPHADGRLEYVLLRPGDDDLIKQVEDCAEWLEGEVTDRLEEGAVCVAAVKGNQLAGFNLVVFGQVYIPLLKLTRTFRPATAWSEHIAVHPAFRGGGLGKSLRLRIFDELRFRGIRKLYGGTLRTNGPALALARSLGFRELADVTYLKALMWKTWLYRRCHRRRRAVAELV
jgi:L-amino acid N-acyltransferase YncA